MVEEKLTDADAPESPNAGTEMTVSPRRAVRRAYRVEIIFALAMALYAGLAVLAHYYAYFAWDLRVALAVQSLNTSLPAFKTGMLWLSVLGNGWVPFALVVNSGLALIGARFRLEGFTCMAGVGLGAVVNRLLKNWSDRPRPSEALIAVEGVFRHESFPSGHVVFFVEYFGFMFFLAYVLLRRGRVRRGALALLAAPVLLIGASRIALGAHWPSDVLGAYLAGGLWLMFMIEVYRRLKARQKKQE